MGGTGQRRRFRRATCAILRASRNEVIQRQIAFWQQGFRQSWARFPWELRIQWTMEPSVPGAKRESLSGRGEKKNSRN
jgi:hypothetical protein